MPHQKKTWIEKRDQPTEHVVKTVDKDFAGMKAGQVMLIATPRIIDEYIRQIPAGHLVDPKTMRQDLALQYRAETTCPVTTGIFLRIVAEAAFEEYREGKPLQEITPFWRVIDRRSKAADKLSFGKDLLLKMQKREGIDN